MPAVPRHHRHPLTSQRMPGIGNFYFCWKPAGVVLQCATDFKDCLGLDQCQARLYTAIQRHIVLVMAALAICAVTAALLRDRAGTQAPPPTAPGQAPPPDPGMIPITVPEVKRLLSAVLTPRKPRGHAARWLALRRRHQARARWFHQRTRLSREYTLVT
jgi:hypothetical protein